MYIVSDSVLQYSIMQYSRVCYIYTVWYSTVWYGLYRIVSCSVYSTAQPSTEWSGSWLFSCWDTLEWHREGHVTVFSAPHLLVQFLSTLWGSLAVAEWEFHGEPQTRPHPLTCSAHGCVAFASVILLKTCPVLLGFFFLLKFLQCLFILLSFWC